MQAYGVEHGADDEGVAVPAGVEGGADDEGVAEPEAAEARRCAPSAAPLDAIIGVYRNARDTNIRSGCYATAELDSRAR